MTALLQSLWVIAVLVLLAAGVLSMIWVPRQRQRKRRLGALATLLGAADPRVRVETLDKAHALSPRDRSLLAKLLRRELTSRGGPASSRARTMMVWFIRQVLALLNDTRVEVRMDAARALRAALGDQVTHGEREEARPFAPPVTAAVELAGGRAFAGSRAARQESRVLAFAEIIEAGLRPLLMADRALEGVGDEALEPLTSALRDRNPRVRRSLCEVLAAMGGERATELLITLLQDPTPDLRARAAQALGSLKALASASHLLKLLKDPIGAVRAAAAAGLAQIGLESACPAILEALAEECRREDASEPARAAMLEAVARLAEGGLPQLSRALTSLMRPVAARLATALQGQGMIGRWLTEPQSPERAELVSGLLASAAELGVSQPFLEALDSTEEQVRLRAAAALGYSHDPGALPALASLLGDPEAAVRGEAVRAVARSAEARALEPLARAAADPDQAVRLVAIAGLAEVLSQRPAWKAELLPSDFDLPAALTEAERALLSAGADEEAAVRRAAASALALCDTAEAAEALVTMSLSDPDSEVQGASTEALARSGFPHTRRLLIGALEGNDEDQRARAMALLGALGGPEAGRSLVEALRDPAPQVREAALSSLSALDLGGLAERLVPELKNADPRIRTAVARQLGRARAGAGAEALVQALSDPEEEVRVAALDALAGLGRAVRRHRGELAARLNDPSARVRGAAVAALAALSTAWAEASGAAEAYREGPLTPAAASALLDAAGEGNLEPLVWALEHAQSAQSLAAFLLGAGRGRLGALLSSLREASERDQARAMSAFSQALRQAGAANGYLAELRAVDSEVRLVAVEIAGMLATPEAVEALVEVLARDPLPEVRAQAAAALGLAPGDPAQAALLRAQAEDPDETVRHLAARALEVSQPAFPGPPAEAA